MERRKLGGNYTGYLEKGFSLIEILVGLIMIAILAIAVGVRYWNDIHQSYAVSLVDSINKIKQAYQEVLAYPNCKVPTTKNQFLAEVVNGTDCPQMAGKYQIPYDKLVDRFPWTTSFGNGGYSLTLYIKNVDTKTGESVQSTLRFCKYDAKQKTLTCDLGNYQQ